MALVKAKLIPEAESGLREIEVQFNPAELTLNKGAQIAEIAIPGLDSPILQFVRGQNEKLTLDLFFDTTELGMGDDATDVRVMTNPVYQLVKIQSRTHAPPRVQFQWGEGGISFHAVVESIQQKFSLFSPKGVPLRATLSVTLREYKYLDKQLQELNLQSADHTRHRAVQQGDTLNRIAAEEYGDPREWRAIADANGLEDPLRLVPGSLLIIPPLDLYGQRTV
jgi:hypothetical protein